MEGETTTAMTAFLAMLTEVCTSLMTQVTKVCSFIIEPRFSFSPSVLCSSVPPLESSPG